MDEALLETYAEYHYLLTQFYEKNKEKIKSSYIDSNASQLEKHDLEYLSELFKQYKSK